MGLGSIVLGISSIIAGGMASGLFGGGQKQKAPTYVVPDAPKQQKQKTQTEAATASRQAQDDKARKAAGIQGSILTGPMGALVQQQTQDRKSLLGQ